MSIWFDITTILTWNRPAVGIVRVESECARHFRNATQSNTRFCCFDRSRGGYVEIDRNHVEEVLIRFKQGLAQQLSPVPEVAAGPAVSALSREERLKLGLLSLINRLPRRLRDAALRFAYTRREAFYGGLRAYQEARFALQTLIGPNLSPSPPALVVPDPAPRPDRQALIFKSGDVYVSMGLDWDQKNLEYLYKLKQDIRLRVILFCYDIIPVKLPHLCVGDVASRFAKYFTDVAWCADKILCISDCSRRDLAQLLHEVGAPEPELSVVRLGSEVPRAPEQLPSANVAEVLRHRYVLFVSTIERRKNHETLYRAYCRLIDAGNIDIPLLVFVGMPGWGVHDLLSDLRLDPRIQPYIRMLNHVSDSDLAQLYRHAEFTVFPSLYEGWGLPVAESLAYGKFCLASNAASIAEFGGDLIEYLDPWDVPAWAERLGWYFRHPEEVAEREARIRLEYRAISWDETGAFVLAQANQLAIP